MEEADFSFEKMRSKWAVEVGRFVMAFGAMEGVTYSALRHCPRDPIARSLIDANLGLKARNDLLIAIARTWSGPNWARFAFLLENLSTLAKKRNLIAHNGVGVNVYVDATGEYHL